MAPAVQVQELNAAQGLRTLLDSEEGRNLLAQAGRYLFQGREAMGLYEQLMRFTAKPGRLIVPSIAVANTKPATQLLDHDPTRVMAYVFNVGSDAVYLGASNVSNATGDMDAGYPLYAGQSLSLGAYTGKLYGLAASGSQDVRVLELSGEMS